MTVELTIKNNQILLTASFSISNEKNEVLWNHSDFHFNWLFLFVLRNEYFILIDYDSTNLELTSLLDIHYVFIFYCSVWISRSQMYWNVSTKQDIIMTDIFRRYYCEILCLLLCLSLWKIHFRASRVLEVNDMKLIYPEVRLQRIFVHNCLAIYITWTSIATMLNFDASFRYFGQFDAEIVTVICCTIFLILLVGWFVLENTVLETVFDIRYTLSQYPGDSLCPYFSHSRSWIRHL